MKKKIFLLIASLVLLMIGLSVIAQVDVPEMQPEEFRDVIIRLVNWLVWLLWLAAGVAIVWAGFIFVTAQGDSDQVTKARKIIIYALVGLLVGFITWGLTNLVEKIVLGS